jgi:general secretion pathway protein E
VDEAVATTAPERRLSFAFAKRHGVLVKRFVDGVAECAYRADTSPMALAEVRRYLRTKVKLERVDEPSFDALLRSAYEGGNSATMEATQGLEDSTDLAHLAQELPDQADLLESEDDAPIIRLINAVLTQAVKENASDIHVEPFENRLVVRFRVDGVLREVLQSRRAVAPLVVSRIKVMSKLDIAEKRLPQDGRISLKIAGRAVDVRVSPFRRATASASCSACSTSRPDGSISPRSAWRCRPRRSSTSSSSSRTASCSSPGPRARARRRRSMPRSSG